MRDALVGRRGSQRSFCLAAALIFGGSTFVLAAPDQSAPPETAAAGGQAQQAKRDFLFGRPIWWLGIRGSLLMPAEGGELFAFVKNQLTIDQGDFRSGAFNFETGFALTPRLDAVVGVETGERSVRS